MGVKTAEWEDSTSGANESIYEHSTIQLNNQTNSHKVSINKNNDSSLVNQPEHICSSEINNITYDKKIHEQENKHGKSPEIELHFGVSESNENPALADTVLITDIDKPISPIKGKSCHDTSVPETQEFQLLDSFLNTTINNCDQRRTDHADDAFESNSANNMHNIKNPCKPVIPISPTKSQLEEFLSKECNSQKINNPALNQFSLEVMYGSPNRKDDEFMNSIFDKINENKFSPIFKSNTHSTPVSSGPENSSAISNSDLFSESPKVNNFDISNLPTKNHTLEEYDPNWGGDSLLELSQNYERNLAYSSKKTRPAKRKLLDECSTDLIKRCCISNINNAAINSTTQQTVIADVKKSIDESFEDSFELNTQIENIVSGKDKIKTPNTSHIKASHKESLNRNVTYHNESKNILKLTSRPKSEGDLLRSSQVIRDSKSILSESFLASAFNGSFTQVITNSDDEVLEDNHISDTEDFINE